MFSYCLVEDATGGHSEDADVIDHQYVNTIHFCSFLHLSSASAISYGRSRF